MFSVPVRFIVFLTILTIVTNSLDGNNLRSYSILDSVITGNHSPSFDSTLQDPLYYAIPNDSLLADSTVSDTIVKRSTSSSPLKDKVSYSAKDSMRVEVGAQKLHLFGDAKVTYQNLELNAEYIVLDLLNEEVFAKGIPDSAGTLTGRPDFKQGGKNFESDSMRYNFTSRNGIIYHIVTQEGEGYLHSDKTKRHSNEHIHLENGKYTTCDADHPHFYMSLTRGIVIPEDKIITGPAYMVILDIPVKFLGLPFGFFPNTTERASGILMPTYGEERTRGFFLREFGWYQTLGNYADWTIRGDVYEKGSWAMRNNLSYKWRYHFSGTFGLNYAKTYNKDEISIPPKYDYAVRWSHRQDPKANPSRNFSANVNFTSSEYDRNYSYSSTNYLTSTTSSSINFSKVWPNTPFNLSLSSNATQNRQTEKVDISLPNGSFNMSTIYPFAKKNGTGNYKWWERIGLTYNSEFRNQLNTYNEVLFMRETWDSLKTAFKHDFPLSVNLKIGKLITITPSMNYSGVLYTHHYRYDDLAPYDSAAGSHSLIRTDYNKIQYEHAINPNLSVRYAPKLYGMYVSTKETSYISAVRHVLSPSAGLSFTPDMKKINDVSYYDVVYIYDSLDNLTPYKNYNWYDEELFTPPSSNGKSGSVSLALNNNLEMKVRPKNDTTGELKKVILLDNLNFNTSYNPFRDSLRWNDVAMVTGTRIFKNKLDIRVTGTFSPYARDSLGRKIDQFYIEHNKWKVLRFTNVSVNTSYSLTSGQKGKGSGSGKSPDKLPGTETAQDDYLYEDYYMEDETGRIPLQYSDSYVDFDIPWTVNFRHSFSLNKTLPGKTNISHTLNLSGDISLTQKWKIGGQLNYDLDKMKLSYTSFNIFRDLHCWEMHISVQPFGERRAYSFTIQAKGSLLRDLKYEKKPNWYDRF